MSTRASRAGTPAATCTYPPPSEVQYTTHRHAESSKIGPVPFSRIGKAGFRNHRFSLTAGRGRGIIYESIDRGGRVGPEGAVLFTTPVAGNGPTADTKL